MKIWVELNKKQRVSSELLSFKNPIYKEKWRTFVNWNK